MFKIGDILIHRQSKVKYIIARASDYDAWKSRVNKIFLIRASVPKTIKLSEGVYYDWIRARNPSNITEEEMNRMTGHTNWCHYFKKFDIEPPKVKNAWPQ